MHDFALLINLLDIAIAHGIANTAFVKNPRSSGAPGTILGTISPASD